MYVQKFEGIENIYLFVLFLVWSIEKNIIKLGFYLSEIKIFWFIKNYFKIYV